MDNNNLEICINDVEIIKEKKEHSEKSEPEESEKSEQPKKCSKIKILAISTGVIAILLTILIILIITFVRVESTRPLSPEEIQGAIKCSFIIEKTGINTDILYHDYKPLYNIDVVIDNKRVEFTKYYKFKERGYHQVNFYINNDENIDYMFKDVSSIVSIEIDSLKFIKNYKYIYRNIIIIHCSIHKHL